MNIGQRVTYVRRPAYALGPGTFATGVIVGETIVGTANAWVIKPDLGTGPINVHKQVVWPVADGAVNK